METTPKTTYTETQQLWRDAVAIMTLRAKDTMGDPFHTRLDKAQALVLAGHVNPHDDGHTATVLSETPGDEKTYTVNGTCECVDVTRGKAPGGWCKHRLAWALYRRAVQHGQQLLVARTEAPAKSSTLDLAPLPEAPISLTMKGTVRGRTGTLVTVRGRTVAEAEAQLDAAAALFDADATEAVRCREVPSNLHAGGDDPEQSPYCDEHDTPYYKNVPKNGNGRVTWSHKLADGSGFCRYRG